MDKVKVGAVLFLLFVALGYAGREDKAEYERTHAPAPKVVP